MAWKFLSGATKGGILRSSKSNQSLSCVKLNLSRSPFSYMDYSELYGKVFSSVAVSVPLECICYNQMTVLLSLTALRIFLIL